MLKGNHFPVFLWIYDIFRNQNIRQIFHSLCDLQFYPIFIFAIINTIIAVLVNQLRKHHNRNNMFLPHKNVKIYYYTPFLHAKRLIVILHLQLRYVNALSHFHQMIFVLYSEEQLGYFHPTLFQNTNETL